MCVMNPQRIKRRHDMMSSLEMMMMNRERKCNPGLGSSYNTLCASSFFQETSNTIVLLPTTARSINAGGRPVKLAASKSASAWACWRKASDWIESEEVGKSTGAWPLIRITTTTTTRQTRLGQLRRPPHQQLATSQLIQYPSRKYRLKVRLEKIKWPLNFVCVWIDGSCTRSLENVLLIVLCAYCYFADNKILSTLGQCEPEMLTTADIMWPEGESSLANLEPALRILITLSELYDRELVAAIGWAKQIPG